VERGNSRGDGSCKKGGEHIGWLRSRRVITGFEIVRFGGGEIGRKPGNPLKGSSLYKEASKKNGEDTEFISGEKKKKKHQARERRRHKHDRAED